MASDLVSLIFEGGTEILKVVGRGDPMVASLAIPTSECPLIGSTVKFGKQLGKGKYGEVFEIDIPGKGSKKYVVKVGKVVAFEETIKKPSDFDKYIKKCGLDVIVAFNPGLSMVAAEAVGKTYIIPEFGIECLATVRKRFVNNMTGGESVLVPPGSYLCSTSAYSEFFIGAMVGESYRSDQCINFFDVYSLFTCPSQNASPDATPPGDTIYNQYIFMDRIHDEYRNLLGENFLNHTKKEINDNIYVQLIFAIAFYQEKYQLSHNDLHPGNLFAEIIRGTTMFRGQLLYQARWFHYKIGERDLYLPAIPLIVKIGDFGLAVKFSTPIVGNKEVFQSGFAKKGGRPLVPNTYMPQYDAIYATNTFASNLGEEDGFIPDSIDFLVNNKPLDTILRPRNARPILENISDCGTAKDLLMSDLFFDKYGTKPNERAVIATLGVM